MCDYQKKDIKEMKSKEKKLLSLLMALKKKGYPIEEVYNTDVAPYGDQTDTETEQLVSKSDREIVRP